MPSSSHDKDSRGDRHGPSRDRPEERRHSRDRERGRHRDRDGRDREREGSRTAKKHRKRHKKGDRHRRHHRQHRSSSSSSSSSPSRSPSRSRSSSPRRGSASSPSSSRRRSLSAARDILTSLVALDPSCRPSLRSLLSALDAGEVVLIDSVADVQARALLHRLLADCLCLETAAAEDGGGQGWRLPSRDREQRLRLLPLLQEALDEPRRNSETERRPAGDSEERREEEDSAKAGIAGAAAQTESSDAKAVDDSRESGSSDGRDSRQALPAPSPAPLAPPAAAALPAAPASQRRVIGPSLPPHLSAAGQTGGTEDDGESEEQAVAGRAQDEELRDDDASYGPQLPSSLTAAESSALAELREARQRAAQTRQLIASLRSSSSSSASADSREEWMTVAPKALSGILTGDAAGMKPRTFSRHGLSERGAAAESGGWTASPAEQEWSRLEREAQRDTDRAVQRVNRARQEAERDRQSRSSSSSAGALNRGETGPTAASSSAAELLLSSAAEPSLLELHQRSLNAAAASRAASAAAARGGPVFWDREKDMGMRRQRSSAAVRAEFAAAAPELSSRFHMSS